jgi:hypothetical protein
MTNYNASDRHQTPNEHSARPHRASRPIVRTALAAVLLAVSLEAAATDMRIDGTYSTSWSPTEQNIGYLFAGFVTRQPNPAVPDHSTFTVGAQINAGNLAGVNQGVWGIATEAWAFQGSQSPLFGIEATAINMEPTNTWPKVPFYATFKNRPDTMVGHQPLDPMNIDSQALRVEAQPGTGFERGIVFAQVSMHASKNLARPVAIDFSEMDEAAVEAVDLIRFPDGCSLVYLGHGVLSTRCDK